MKTPTENLERACLLRAALICTGIAAAALALIALCGCSTSNQKNAAAFVQKIAAMNVSASKIEQRTSGPFFNHSESATGLSWTPSGFNLIDVSAEFNVPVPVLGVPLFHFEFSAQTLTGSKAALSALAPSVPR